MLIAEMGMTVGRARMTTTNEVHKMAVKLTVGRQNCQEEVACDEAGGRLTKVHQEAASEGEGSRAELNVGVITEKKLGHNRDNVAVQEEERRTTLARRRRETGQTSPRLTSCPAPWHRERKWRPPQCNSQSSGDP
jgi:hypothetical protein